MSNFIATLLTQLNTELGLSNIKWVYRLNGKYFAAVIYREGIKETRWFDIWSKDFLKMKTDKCYTIKELEKLYASCQ